MKNSQLSIEFTHTPVKCESCSKWLHLVRLNFRLYIVLMETVVLVLMGNYCHRYLGMTAPVYRARKNHTIAGVFLTNDSGGAREWAFLTTSLCGVFVFPVNS